MTYIPFPWSTVATNQYLAGPALFTLSGNEQPNGTVYTGSQGNRMTYDNTRAYVGTQSIKCQTVLGQPPATCGGSVWFGGRFNLPALIPAGYSIWFRARFYLPSTLPMGYCFGTSDTTDAATCSQPADGSGSTKWLVLAPDTGTDRLYTNLMTPRRAMGLDNGFRMISEAQNDGNFVDNTTVIPRDQWFSLQMQIYLAAGTNAGYMRLWLNDTYIGQLTKATLANSSYKIKEWGLGDYWNGVPWTDGGGSRTDLLWMDDVIIATDYTGYGAPLTVDSGGRPYISTAATVEGL
jgi:hypothetical protein